MAGLLHSCPGALVLVALWCMVCALGGWPLKGVTEQTELLILLEQLLPSSEGVPPFELWDLARQDFTGDQAYRIIQAFAA